MKNYIYCRFLGNTFEDFYECIGRNSWNTWDKSYDILNKLGGKWYNKIPFRMDYK